MFSRKYESGYEKKKIKKKRIENLIQYKKWALDKFIMTNKKNTTSSNTNLIEEQSTINEIRDNIMMEKTLTRRIMTKML